MAEYDSTNLLVCGLLRVGIRVLIVLCDSEQWLWRDCVAERIEFIL